MTRHPTLTSVLTVILVFAAVVAVLQLAASGADISANSPAHFRIALTARMMVMT